MSENELPRNAEEAVTDADLIRYLDGEITRATRARLDALMIEHRAVAARLEQLRHRSTRLSDLLAHAGPDVTQIRHSSATMRPHVLRHPAHPPPPLLRVPAAMKVAAAVALLLGLVLAVPDARAWVAARVRDVAAAIGIAAPEPSRDATLHMPAAAPPVAAVSVSFAVGDTADITVQGAGVLIMRRGTVVQATAETTDADARFTVMPGGLRIEGPAAPDASYTFTVPARVTAVRVRTTTGLRLYPWPRHEQELRIDVVQP